MKVLFLKKNSENGQSVQISLALSRTVTGHKNCYLKRISNNLIIVSEKSMEQNLYR